jgi:hypothetical protein
MSNIAILFKSGERREFRHEGRAGGSYTKTLSYEGEGAYAVVEDEWGTRTAFPTADIAEIQVTPNRVW